MSFGLKSILFIAALGFTVQLQAAPGTATKPKVRSGSVGTAPAVKAPVAGSARISVTGPAAVMAVPGSTVVPAGAAATNGFAPAAHGGSELDMTSDAGLSAAEAATLRAGLSEGVLQELNTAQAELLNSVTSVNADQEAALDVFVTKTVPSWACGESCARTVIGVLAAGTEYTAAAVQQGQDVSAGQGFAQGLKAMDLLDQAKGACPAELGSLIGG